MTINTYKTCKAITNTLKSKLLAGIEQNKVQIYSQANFNKLTKIHNQIAVNKESYEIPYIVINTIGQQEEQKNILGIDIDFAIPGNPIEIEIDGVVEYENRDKLAEFADIIESLVSKACTDYSDLKTVFRPNDINKQKKEYSGNIQLTFTSPILLSRR